MFRDVRPEDVFTPRSATVNKSMYIDRPEHERELRRAIRSGYHVIIYGDSGCGKSWLYKKVFDDDRVAYATLDLNNCQTADDIDLLMLELTENDEEWVEEERTVTVEKGAMPNSIGRKSSGARVLRKRQESAFEKMCKQVRLGAKSRKALVVFENLEHAVANEEVVAYLRSLILALDDASVAKSNVQICFVGVPSDIKMILSDNNKFQTISNRVTEIPEISRMSRDQAKHLVQQGFVKELEMEVENFDFCLSQIIYLTDRIPQYLQDLCLQIAYCAEDTGNTVSPGIVVDGAHNWIDTNGRQSREFVEAIIGHGRKKTDHKSRIILALAKCERVNFYASDIEDLLRELFPKSTARKRVHAARALNSLASGEMRLLKFDESTKKYRIATPKLRSVIRHCVDIDSDDESVVVREAHRPEQ